MSYFVNVLLNAICLFFINAATVVFLHVFYDVGFLWHKKKALLFLLVSVAQIVLDLAIYSFSFMFGLIMYIPLAIFATYDYNGKKIGASLRYILCTLFLQFPVASFPILFAVVTSQGLIDGMASPVFTGVFEFTENYLLMSQDSYISNIACIYFFASFFFSVYGIYRKGIAIRCKKVEICLILALSLVELLSVVEIIDYALTGNTQQLCIWIACLGCMRSFSYIFFIYFSRITGYYRKRTDIQETHIQAELAHFQQYQKSQQENSRFLHDVRNNLLCINDLLQQGKSDVASEYLNDLLEIVEKSSKKYVTGVELLDSIVGAKAQIMEQHGIRFELDGVLAGGLPWKPMDICNVFANAFDNAIEACMNVAPEKRFISMRIKSTPQFWFVTIDNSVAQAVDCSKLFRKNGGYTSKSNSAKHGIGTYNMKYTVESYGAALKADCTDEIFILQIMIDKSSPE